MQSEPDMAPRTGFISVMGWLTLLTSAFCAAGSMITFVVLTFVAPELPRQLQEMASAQGGGGWMLEHFGMLALGASIFWLVGVAVGVGLLRRMNWARLSTMGYVALITIWHLVTWLGGDNEMVPAGAVLPGSEVTPEMQLLLEMQQQAMLGGMSTVVTIFSIVLVLLHVWLIWKLWTKPLRAEFGVPGSPV